MKKIGIIFYSFFFSFFVISITFAKQTVEDATTALNNVAGRVGVEQTSLTSYLGTIIKTVLAISGTLFFILMVYAGFRWMTARGEEDKITKARGTLIGAIIGLAVLIAAYAITSFVTTRIIEGKANEGTSVNFDNTDFTNIGCCFDKVHNPDGNITFWAWRITTQLDCKETGEQARANDDIFGAGTWQFQKVESQQQCQSLYDTFCQSEDCYDLSVSF